VSGIITLSSAQSMEEVAADPPAQDETKEGAETKEDSGAADAPGPAADAPAPKKKYKKTNLAFTVDTFMRYSKAAMDALVEDEARMANADRVAAETAAKRNELESYLYSMRDKIIGELKEFCTEAEAQAFGKALEDAEEWLYSDEGFDSTKSVYTAKLEEVQKFGTPIERRQVESRARQAGVDSLKSSLEIYQKFVQSSDDKYAHVTDDERSTVRSAVSSAESWLYEMIEKQASLPTSVDPVLTTAVLQERQKDLASTCNPIMHKPAPLPPKVDEAKSDEAKANDDEAKGGAGEGDKGKDEDDGKPMETDEGNGGKEEVPPPPEPMETE